MKVSRNLFVPLGISLFLLGMLSIFLSIVGVYLAPLAFLERTLGGLAAFLIKLVMLVGGLMLAYLSHKDWSEEGDA